MNMYVYERTHIHTNVNMGMYLPIFFFSRISLFAKKISGMPISESATIPIH